MGINTFFRKVWNGAKTGATKVWGGLKKGAEFVGRMTKPIANIASTAGQILSVLPGKVGDFGKSLNRGIDAVKGIINMLPNSNVKDKLNNAVSTGSNFINDKIDRGKQFTENVNSKAQPWIQSSSQIADRINRYATDFTNH